MITTSILLFILSGVFKWLRDRINNRRFTQITLPDTPLYQNGTGKKTMGIYSDWWHRADFLHMACLSTGCAMLHYVTLGNIFIEAAIGLAISLLTFTILWNSSLLIKKQ